MKFYKIIKQKIYITCLTFLLLKSFSVFAQSKADSVFYNAIYNAFAKSLEHDTTQTNNYFSAIFAGPALFFHPQTNGLLTVSFPYTVKDVNGNISNQLFKATTTNLFAQNTFKVGFISAELGNSINYASLSLVMIIRKDINAEVILNYGFSLAFNNHFKLLNKKNNPDKLFAIKPSIGFGYSYYSSANMGSIDAKDKYITVFNSTSAPTFTTSVKYFQTDTRTTNSIDVSYVQSNYSLIPKLTFSFYSGQTPWFFEVYASYFIPVYASGNIELYQNDGQNETKYLSAEKLNASNLSVNYNTTKINQYAFKFTGLQAGLNVGYIIDLVPHAKAKRDANGNRIKWYNR